jgi:hypothetical protein
MILSSYWDETILEINYHSKELEGWAEQIKAEYMRIKEEEILEDF